MADIIYKAAIVGCGQIAGDYDHHVPSSNGIQDWSVTHAGGYALCPNVKLVAVADPSDEKRKTFANRWSVERSYALVEEMLHNESIDILSICSPTHTHFSVFQLAISKNIPAIFMEKPLSDDINEARQMLELGKSTLVSVNFFRRWNTDLQELREKLQKGELGNALQATFRYTKGIYGNCSHLIDISRWYFGEPVEYGAIRLSDDRMNDPGVDFYLKFQGNLVAHFLHVPARDYVFIDCDILTDQGRIVIGQRGQELTVYGQILDRNYGLTALARKETFETRWKNSPTRAITELTTLLRSGGRPTCTLEDGFQATFIANRIHKECLLRPTSE